MASSLLSGPVTDGAATADQQRSATIESLLRERAGLVARGRPDRVAQVDAELERLGHAMTESAPFPVERATVKPKQASKATAGR